MKHSHASQQGFAALATTLILSAALTIVLITVSLSSITEAQMALAGDQGAKTRLLVHGCAELALLQLNTTNTLPTTVTIPAGSCTVTTISQVGTVWTFTVSGNIGGYVHTNRLVVNRTTTIAITTWEEQ